ncbi:MAG: hypothetical protein HY924_04615 [Elusimicrobia bacterium]|nr:hypothetical protein [Elusimicrobiota bacterium]
MKHARRIPAIGLSLLALAGRVRAEPPREADAFLPEDWIVTVEPTHPTHRGMHWYYDDMMLPYRAIQRAKHALETRYGGNWRLGGENGGAAGVALRFFVGTVPDFGLFMAGQNLHHAAGHDAAAREFALSFGDRRSVPSRFTQVLPNYLGGRLLRTAERQPDGRGADALSRAMSLPMEAELVFGYEQGKELLASRSSNATAVQRFLLYRTRFLMDYAENGTLDQAFIDSQQPGASGRISGPGFSTDFTWYLHYLNRNRYGVLRVDDYKLKTGDIKTAFYLQAADPLMWTALYAWGRDYLVGARNTTSLPMIRLGAEAAYFPSLRVFFSPFGVEYFQDNYARRRGALANAYWTVGDNRYEKRYGAGLDVRGISLPHGITLGAYVQLHRQPLLSRITDQTPLSPAETGQGHLAYNLGGTLQIPVWTFGSGPDPRRLFLHARAGIKNLSWFPGEYLGSGAYVQTGLGVRL